MNNIKFILLSAIFIFGSAAEAATRTAPVSRAPLARAAIAPTMQTTPVAEEPTPEPEPTPAAPTGPLVRPPDLSHLFEVQSNETSLERMIREQRQALAAGDAMNLIQANLSRFAAGTGNACDAGLRRCMQEKCGEDFSGCLRDTSVIWNDKIESCGRSVQCSGRELNLFGPEILADRDQNALLAGYRQIKNCGLNYNRCILMNCSDAPCNENALLNGRCDFNKCISSSEGDAAIARCRDIAERCREQDSGLAARAMELFANLRVEMERNIAAWEQQLHDLRAEMRRECERIGGVFDNRSLSCVFHVELAAAGFETVAGSRTIAAGSEFMCTPEWFGVDVSTYLENAARHDRESRGAVMAVAGAGVGIGVGALASGAIGRAGDVRQADRAVTREQCDQALRAGQPVEWVPTRREQNNRDENFFSGMINGRCECPGRQTFNTERMVCE